MENISQFESNMGGTEILKPIEYILKQKEVKGYSRNVYVITDGWVNDVQGTLNSIEKNLNNSRIYSIGIG